VLDFCVIGGGSAGVRAARIASEHGAKVVLIEAGRVGGTCVHAGCIPKKLLVYAAQHAAALAAAPSYGFAPDIAAGREFPDWSKLIAAIHAETDQLGELYERRLRDAGVRIERGQARIVGPGRIRLGAEELQARHIAIATGAVPYVPPIPGVQLGITSDEFFELKRLPERVVVVGGGYIALELSGVLVGLGAKVQLVHRGKALLTGFDHDVSAHLALELPKLGIALHLCNELRAIEAGPAGQRAVLSNGAVLDCDAVVLATGRTPRTEGLGLEALGVALDAQGGVRVDAYSASSVPGVHAIGDVTGRLALTPVAIAEGHALADTLFGGQPRSVHSMLVPTAVFSEPEVAAVGETEYGARERGAKVEIYRGTFRPLEHALGAKKTRALVKLVVEEGRGRVLGCHVVAPHAAEIVQGLAAAMSAGVTKAQLDATTGIHPTIGEELLTLRRPVALA
jgi:glutathione reductase (NADPH)